MIEGQRLNFFGRPIGKPKPLEHLDRVTVTDLPRTTDQVADFEEIAMGADRRVRLVGVNESEARLLTSSYREIKDPSGRIRLHVTKTSAVLTGDDITAARLETPRDRFGRRTVYTYRKPL